MMCGSGISGEHLIGRHLFVFVPDRGICWSVGDGGIWMMALVWLGCYLITCWLVCSLLWLVVTLGYWWDE